MIKKLKFATLLLLLMPILSGCNFVNDNDLQFVVKENEFVNYCDDYKIEEKTFHTYYLDGGDVPYLNVTEFLTNLCGYFANRGIYVKTNALSNLYTISYVRGNNIRKLELNWKNNTISSYKFISFINSIVNSSGSTNYSSKLAYSYDWTINTPLKVEFDLDDYGFDIYYYKRSVLMPYIVLNSLFCSPNYFNLYFNGDTYYGIYSFLNSSSSHYQELITSSKNNQTPSQEFRDATYNHLRFVMDYYYGLNNYKNITSWDMTLAEQGLKDKILSLDSEENADAYYTLFFQYLNDLHSSLTSTGYYLSPDGHTSVPSKYIEGTKYDSYFDNLDVLETLRGDKELLRFVDNTAIITLDGFLTGTNEQIQTEDAWKYDSFYFMQRCLDEIKKDNNVENIVLDLSTNGGGNIGAMLRVLGFLTDEDIPYGTYNSLDKSTSFTYYIVDTDSNDEYYDHDSCDSYNWYVLTSSCSFSAANTFAAIAKSMGIATIIGEQSGGGMCSVLPTLLMDGTSIRLSSYNCIVSLNNNGEIVEIEDGIAIDNGYEICDYSNFYNDTYISNLINQ